MTVVLRAITDENREEVVALRVASSQMRFVGTVADALADAAEIPEGKGCIERSTSTMSPSGS